MVTVRLIGLASPLPVTSFGANYDSYVAAMRLRKDDVSLVKLVYRFMNYDPRFPASLVDYDFVHKFRAVREPDCDEAVDTMLFSHRITASGATAGRDLTFEYAKHAAQIAVAPPTVLPCYVVSPADYKGSKHLPAGPSNSAVADDGSSPPSH
jgi:hypothetical protein